MNSVVQNLKIEQIRTDGGTQPRAKLNEATVAEYGEAITEGAKFPPVMVFHDGSEYWLADGFHRLFAHKKIGALDIEAEVHQGVKRDAILYSVGANYSHGLRRSNEDKRKAVMTLLEDAEWSKWSDREIARQCVVSPSTVSAYRKDLTVQLDSEPEIAERNYTTKHGTEAVMNTANIGKTRRELDRDQGTQEQLRKQKRTIESRPADIPPEDHADELAEARFTITELSEEVEELRDRLAVEAMDATDDEKFQALTTIKELRAQVKTLEAELEAVKSMRDQYMTESAEKSKQIAYWRKEAKKVAA